MYISRHCFLSRLTLFRRSENKGLLPAANAFCMSFIDKSFQIICHPRTVSITCTLIDLSGIIVFNPQFIMSVKIVSFHREIESMIKYLQMERSGKTGQD